MKTKIRYNDKLLNRISWFMKVWGITLFPYIFLREKYRDYPFYKKAAPILINHESIHIEQQKEIIILATVILILLKITLGFGFWWAIPIFGYLTYYVMYLLEWFIRLFMKGNAYKNISFEREAYSNDSNLSYLKTRKRYSFLKYYKK